MGRPPVNKKMTYLGVFEGFITEKVAEGTKDSVVRTLSSGGTRSELQYPYWEGMITSIKYKEGKSKDQTKIIKSWNVSITDEDDEQFVLSVPYESRYASTLYKKARSIDFNIKVRIVPYGFINEDGKSVRGFNFYQGEGDDSKKVEDYWTKETLPAPVEVTKPDGGTGWDYSAINNKLEQDFIALIANQFDTEEAPPANVDTETGEVYHAPEDSLKGMKEEIAAEAVHPGVEAGDPGPPEPVGHTAPPTSSTSEPMDDLPF